MGEILHGMGIHGCYGFWVKEGFYYSGIEDAVYGGT